MLEHVLGRYVDLIEWFLTGYGYKNVKGLILSLYFLKYGRLTWREVMAIKDAKTRTRTGSRHEFERVRSHMVEAGHWIQIKQGVYDLAPKFRQELYTMLMT